MIFMSIVAYITHYALMLVMLFQ